MWVRSLGWEDPLEKGIFSVFLPRELLDRETWWATAYRVAQSQTSSLVNFKEHFQYLSQGDTRHIVGAQHISFEPN